MELKIWCALYDCYTNDLEKCEEHPNRYKTDCEICPNAVVEEDDKWVSMN